MINGEGQFISSNGHKYLMRFRNGEATGTGELFIRESSIYKGELLNGIPHGKGVIEYVIDGKTKGKYAGGFWFGRRNGSGISYAEDGTGAPSDWIFGRLKIDLSEELTYVGEVNAQMKPHGWGLCLYKKRDNKIEWCNYKDGAPNQDKKE